MGRQPALNTGDGIGRGVRSFHSPPIWSVLLNGRQRGSNPRAWPPVTDVRSVYVPPVKEASESGLPFLRSPVGAGPQSAGPAPLDTTLPKGGRNSTILRDGKPS